MRFILACCLILLPAIPAAAQSRAELQDWLRKLDSGKKEKVEEARRNFVAMDRQASADRSEDRIVFARLHIAFCDYRLGQQEAAKAAMEKLIRDFPNNRQRVLLHQYLGEWYQIAWQSKQAAPHLNKAHELAVAARRPPVEIAKIRLSKAINDVTSGENKRARDEFDQLIKEMSPLLDKDSVALDVYAQSLLQLSELDSRDQLAASSLERLKTVEKLMEKVNPPTWESVAKQYTCCLWLSTSYRLLTRFKDAEQELERGRRLLDKNRQLLGDSRYYRHREEWENAYAGLLVEWAELDLEVLEDQDALLTRLQAAETATRQAQSLHSQVATDKTKESANSLNLLASIGKLRGRLQDRAGKEQEARQSYAQARRHCTECLELFAKLLEEPTHDAVMEQLRQRAWLDRQLGDREQALRDARQVLKQYLTRYRDEVQLLTIHQLLIELEADAGNLEAATDHAREHRRLRDQYLLSYTTRLTATGQQTFFRRWYDPGLHLGLSLAVAKPNPALNSLSAEWLLNGKAKSAEMLARVSRELHGNETFRNRLRDQASLLYGAKAEELERRLLELASLSAPPPTEQDQQVRDRLQEQTENLRQELQDSLLRLETAQRLLAETRETGLNLPEREYQLDDVRKSLQAGETLIDLFCLKGEGENRPVCEYYAWIVPPAGDEPVQIVRLGDAAEIDRLANQLIDYLQESRIQPAADPRTIRADEIRLRRECLLPLSEAVLHPLWKAAGANRKWIVSPDGELWNLPWAALLVPESNDYAVRHLTVRHVISARDVCRRNPAPASLGPPLVLAHPDFDKSVATGAVRRRIGTVAALSDHTGKLRKHLQQNGVEPVVYTEEQVAPERLERIALPPRVLYLDTHGVFLGRTRLRVDDPFLCCHVCLSGYNLLPPAANAQLPGVFTGAEVLLSNLTGTELVVLSACETGRGISAYGHSAASLRHAFHLAGARAVVASNWSVWNDPTALLMLKFMSLSSAGELDKAESLRQAQLWLIGQFENGYPQPFEPGRQYHSHPHFWAAFSVSGF